MEAAMNSISQFKKNQICCSGQITYSRGFGKFAELQVDTKHILDEKALPVVNMLLTSAIYNYFRKSLS